MTVSIETPAPFAPFTSTVFDRSSFNHKYATLGGHRYHYVEEGDPKNPTLFLLHGFPDLWYGWRYQIKFLAEKGYHVIAIDNLGSGETDQPRCVGTDVQPYRSKNLASNYMELLDQLNVDKAIFIGHDWGSFIAWKVGMHYPGRCHAVISLGNPHRFPTEEYVGVNEMAAENPGFFYFPMFETDAMELNYGGDFRAQARNMLDGFYKDQIGTSKDDVDFYVDNFAKKGLHGALNLYRSFRLNHDDEREFVGKPYTVPAYLVIVEQDSILTPAYVASLSTELFEDLETSSISKGTHNVMTENPLATNQELERILANAVAKIGSKKQPQEIAHAQEE